IDDPTRSSCCSPDSPCASVWRRSGRDDLFLLLRLRLLDHEATLHDLVEQRLIADLQQARGLRTIPVDAIEHFLDRHALGLASRLPGDVLETDRRVGSHDGGDSNRSAGSAHARTATDIAEDLGVHGPRRAEDHDTLHGIFELPDVAWPVILDQD